MRPHVCHSCRRGGAEHGPYFEDDFHYPDPRTGSECRLYTCRDCFGNHLFAAGSPWADEVVRAARALEEAQTERDLADAQAQELREALDAANQRIAALDGQPGLSTDEYAAKLAAALEDRWGTPPASWRERIGGRR